jgi:hypothetical protein
VIERTFSSARGPGVALLRRSTLKHWPPLQKEMVAPPMPAVTMTSGPSAAPAKAVRARRAA